MSNMNYTILSGNSSINSNYYHFNGNAGNLMVTKPLVYTSGSEFTFTATTTWGDGATFFSTDPFKVPTDHFFDPGATGSCKRCVQDSVFGTNEEAHAFDIHEEPDEEYWRDQLAS